jgi:DNA mismatch repair protein MutS
MGTDTKEKPSKVGRGAGVPASSDALTPAMRQYVEQKRRVGEAVLLFRMGDFYETFYDDAVLCSKVLGIALTSRSKDAADPIPLAGIPYHALESYLKKLVSAGYKVAISEQLEDPKQAKGVVKRDVVRIVTAGTLTDDALLAATDDNTLACVCIRDKEVGLALVELAGARLEVLEVSPEGLLDQLVREGPAEVLIDDERGSGGERIAKDLGALCGTSMTRRPVHEFSTYRAERTLLEHFGVSTLAGFGFERMSASLCAAGCLIQYLQETQQTALKHITSIRRRVSSDFMQIDHGTWRSLEIDRTLRSGSAEGTLLHAIDRTVHPIGARRLRQWLRGPLTDRAAILDRQRAVQWFMEDEPRRGRVRRLLKSMADVERIASRVALNRCSPRDLASLGKTLSLLPQLGKELSGNDGLSGEPSTDDHGSPSTNAGGAELSGFLSSVADRFVGLEELSDLLGRAIREEPPLSPREGGTINDGFDAELDRLRSIGHDGRTWLADYQRRQVEQTGIASLKVGFNRVFGYYIEIPHSAKADVPPDFVRKQTIKNAERYITDELKRYEEEVLTARERANELEYTLFERLRGAVAEHTEKLLSVADGIGRLDCVAGLGELAVQRRYVRPDIVEDIVLDVRDGRHPVLDQTLTDAFVPNDCVMNGDAFVFVITGPNMAGKSTYIRQVALMTLLAQIGSFVPATRMRFSVVDRLFARVGSADEIMRGQSTFMVEMTEAANILHNATRRSLVVLDELGRGTSTFDGLSLAWAITEHLACEVKCRSLVATHYHELVELAGLLRGVRNYNVAVRELPGRGGGDDGLAFLHKIVEGGASKSYGVHVAKLAGIPEAVIRRAREVMDELQRGFERESRSPQLARKKTKDDPQLALFRDPGEELLEALRAIDVNATTPLEALERVKSWKDQYG